jgi:hypothetical protein
VAVALLAWLLAFPALAGQVSLAWDASTAPTVTGYYLYYGVASRTYTSQIDVGNQTGSTVSNLTAGQTYFFAVKAYDAARNESPFSNEVSGTITAPTPATTTLASSTNPATFGASVTFTATVSGSAPTGTVTFSASGTTIGGCSAAALGGSGNVRTATCVTASLAVGTYSIVARYNGDAGNGASSSAPVAQIVGKVSTATDLTSSLNPSSLGASVTLTASVTGSAPTGTVNFVDGGTSITGCAARSLSGTGNTRTATCTKTSLASGAHSIVASYEGNATNAASSSGALSQVVNVVAPPPPTFADVPAGHWAYAAIEAIAYNSITLGCASNPLRFCPNGDVGRDEMAVFLERAIRGIGYPFAPTGVLFADVSITHWAVGSIEQLYTDDITLGCGVSPLRFCPDGIVTRAEIAIFLLRARYGPGFDPGTATGLVFADVPNTHWAAAWIEKFAAFGYTNGCSIGPLEFCPDDVVTRAGMAVFMQQVFNLAGPPP